jgi:DNA-binding MarR family transcriptional regulator
LGITVAQANALLHLDRYPEATMARLASVAPLTMHRVVVGLKRRGFVRRQPLERDNKSLTVSITDTGAEVLGRATAVLKKGQDLLLTRFTESELNLLGGLLRSMTCS